MKVSKNPVLSTLLSVGVAGGAMALPGISHAELETSLHMHTINMFRGQSESAFAPAFHGEIEYDHSSGLYAGTEIVNSAEGGGLEWDIMYGYEREFGDIGFNIGLVHYMFPMATEDHDDDPYTEDQRSKIADSSELEFKIGVSYGDYGVTYFTNTDADEDYSYISLDYSGKLFGAHLGMTSASDEDSVTGEKIEGNYSDLALSYALSKEVTFTISFAFGDAVGDEVEDVEGDPLVMLSYEIPLGGNKEM